MCAILLRGATSSLPQTIHSLRFSLPLGFQKRGVLPSPSSLLRICSANVTPLVISVRLYYPRDSKGSSTVNFPPSPQPPYFRRPTSTPHDHTNNSNSSASSSWRGPVKDRFPSPLCNFSDPRQRLAVLIDARNVHVLDALATYANPSSLPTQVAAEGVGQSGEIPLSSTSHPSPPLPPLSPTVLQAIQSVGVPVLFRVFAHRFTLPAVWEPFCQPWQRFVHSTLPDPSISSSHAISSSTGSSDSNTRGSAERISSATSLYASFQLFTVEPFIPVAMQMEADADHLFRFKEENGVEGICYVIPEVDREAWIERVPRVAEQWEHLLQQHANRQGGDGNNITTRRKNESQDLTTQPEVSKTFFNQYVLDHMGMLFQRFSEEEQCRQEPQKE